MSAVEIDLPGTYLVWPRCNHRDPDRVPVPFEVKRKAFIQGCPMCGLEPYVEQVNSEYEFDLVASSAPDKGGNVGTYAQYLEDVRFDRENAPQIAAPLNAPPLLLGDSKLSVARRLRLVCLPCRESLKVTLRTNGDRRARAILEDRIDQLERAWAERHAGCFEETP